MKDYRQEGGVERQLAGQFGEGGFGTAHLCTRARTGRRTISPPVAYVLVFGG